MARINFGIMDTRGFYRRELSRERGANDCLLDALIAQCKDVYPGYANLSVKTFLA